MPNSCARAGLPGPRLIASCAAEVGSDVATANKLYLTTLEHASPRSPMWESAIKDLLLMLAMQHRISDDIDLLFRDPQWIGWHPR